MIRERPTFRLPWLRAPLLALLAVACSSAAPAPGPSSAPALRFDADIGGSLQASLYSLPARFFTAAECGAFLRSVRGVAPKRTLLALVDAAQARALGAVARELEVHLLVATRDDFSPWPRDPFSLTHDAAGRVVVLVRPNLQHGREADAEMGAELLRDLPAGLAKEWGGPRLATADIPFHNGQVLLTSDTAWVTIHTLEPHILRLLHLDRVPVADFSTAAGVERYVTAAAQAARQLETLYGRPVRFVHRLPRDGADEEQHRAMYVLAGGAGFDLDSVLTLLPGAPAPRALIGDINAGTKLAAELTRSDAATLRAAYDFALPVAELPSRLAAAQTEPRAAGLAAFLDLVAGGMRAAGFVVDRLPLLLVPTRFLADADPSGAADFVLGWNNVVIESTPRGTRAEGFASLLPAGDRAATEIFGHAGVKLDLLTPLVPSVILGGGYRCASNQLKTKR